MPKKKPKPETFVLTQEELYVAFAAMTAMVHDVHAVQDQLTEEQWQRADDLVTRMETEVNRKGLG